MSEATKIVLFVLVATMLVGIGLGVAALTA